MLKSSNFTINIVKTDVEGKFVIIKIVIIKIVTVVTIRLQLLIILLFDWKKADKLTPSSLSVTWNLRSNLDFLKYQQKYVYIVRYLVRLFVFLSYVFVRSIVKKGSVIKVENFNIDTHFEDGALTSKFKMGYKVEILLGTKFKVTRESYKQKGYVRLKEC